MSRHQRRSVKKPNKKLVRPGMFRTYREPDPYYVQQGSGFWYAYKADGGGQDRGPEELGTFLTQEEAEAALRKKRAGIPRKKAKHKKLPVKNPGT